MKRPTLRTQRLTLRPHALEDAPAIQRLCGAYEVALNTLMIPHPYPDGAAAQWIAKQDERDDEQQPEDCRDPAFERVRDFRFHHESVDAANVAKVRPRAVILDCGGCATAFFYGVQKRQRSCRSPKSLPRAKAVGRLLD